MDKPININDTQLAISKEINEQVISVLSDKLQGVEKTFVMANAIQKMKQLFTPEVMEPIMQLQGSTLGFKTDKDLVKNKSGKYVKGPGYPVEIVRDVFIEASLLGFQGVGNQFNIIGGNFYPTREGFSYQLDTMDKLDYDISYEKINQSQDKKTASALVKIEWKYGNIKGSKTINFPIKSDYYTTTGALKGKAERKAKCWLFNKLKGTNLSDGDAVDVEFEDVTEQKPNAREVDKDKNVKRVTAHIEQSKTTKTLERCREAIPADNDELLQEYLSKWIELSKTVEELEHVGADIKDEYFELIIAFDDKKKELSKK